MTCAPSCWSWSRGRAASTRWTRAYVHDLAVLCRRAGLAAAGGRGPDRHRPHRHPVLPSSSTASSPTWSPSPRGSPVACPWAASWPARSAAGRAGPGHPRLHLRRQPRAAPPRAWRCWTSMDQDLPGPASRRRARYLRAVLSQAMALPCLGDVRGHGPDDRRGGQGGHGPTRSWPLSCIENGLLVPHRRAPACACCRPLTITKEEMDKGLAILEADPLG